MLTGRMLPAHPHPKSGELLTSWLARTAIANHTKLYRLNARIFNDGPGIWNRDIDKSISRDQLLKLNKATGASVHQIHKTTLKSYEGILYKTHNAHGNTPWIVPAGVFHRVRTRKWLMFCPLCLVEDDDEPYYRKSWRLAFNTVCAKHRTWLLDACPACGESVMFFRREMGNRSIHVLDSIVLCWNCDFDLRRSPAVHPPVYDLHSHISLISLLTFMEIGWWFVDECVLHYSPLYFDVLHYLVHFLNSSPGRLMRNVIDRSIPGLIQDPETRLVFEQRPLADRHILLIQVLWLLHDWPHRFVNIQKQARICATRITRSEVFPFWFESALKNAHSAYYLDRTSPADPWAPGDAWRVRPASRTQST